MIVKPFGCTSIHNISAIKMHHSFIQQPPQVHTLKFKPTSFEPTVQHSDNPLLYWKVNQPRLPSLAATATKFLSAPSTSVESERLFSTASVIIDERRSSLTAEKAEMLIFLKMNLLLMLK